MRVPLCLSTCRGRGGGKNKTNTGKMIQLESHFGGDPSYLKPLGKRPPIGALREKGKRQGFLGRKEKRRPAGTLFFQKLTITKTFTFDKPRGAESKLWKQTLAFTNHHEKEAPEWEEGQKKGAPPRVRSINSIRARPVRLPHLGSAKKKDTKPECEKSAYPQKSRRRNMERVLRPSQHPINILEDNLARNIENPTEKKYPSQGGMDDGGPTQNLVCFSMWLPIRKTEKKGKKGIRRPRDKGRAQGNLGTEKNQNDDLSLPPFFRPGREQKKKGQTKSLQKRGSRVRKKRGRFVKLFFASYLSGKECGSVLMGRVGLTPGPEKKKVPPEREKGEPHRKKSHREPSIT